MPKSKDSFYQKTKHTHNFDKQQHTVCVRINQINTTIHSLYEDTKQQTVCVRIETENNKQFVHG